MFIKLGSYYFAADQIVYIHEFPSGVRVLLKTGITVDVMDIDKHDMDVIKFNTVNPHYGLGEEEI